MRISILTTIIAGLVLSCEQGRPLTDLDTTNIEPTPGFLFADTISGTIIKSTDGKSIGEKVTFIDLSSSSPRVTFSGSGVTSRMEKLVELEDIVVLQLFTGSSFDTFIINKKTGLFTRSYCGTMLDDLYSGCAIGICR